MAAASTIALMGTSLFGGALGARGEEAEAAFYEQQAEANARFNEMKAREVVKIGEESAASHGRKVKSLIGRQRAALAAQGIVVDEGTAAQIQEDTAEIGRSEMRTIKNNAFREAFGYKAQAEQDRQSALFARQAGGMRATASLVSGGLGAARDFFGSDTGKMVLGPKKGKKVLGG